MRCLSFGQVEVSEGNSLRLERSSRRIDVNAHMGTLPTDVGSL